MRINDTYEVTIEGEVINSKTKRVLKTTLAGSGYKSLRLGAGKHYYVHRLVATAFLPAPTSEKCEVDHIDRNKLNNHATNLRWVSREANMSNLNIEQKPRASNKHGEHHIKRIMTNRQVTPSYAVVYDTKHFKHYSLHKTLEEAIEKRNSLFQ
jgi:hypothetical protein